MKTNIIFLSMLVVCGCAHTAQLARVDGLTMMLPSAFKAEKTVGKDPSGDMIVGRWRSPTGEVVELMAWPKGPSVDRGTMIAATEETLEVAGQTTTLIKTKVFFGSIEEVLVIHLRQGESHYIVSAKGFAAKDFKSILKSVELKKD